MTMKNNRAQPEGRSQPEIRPGDVWQDSFGSRVTITDVLINRISYVRNGCAHPCIASLDRLRREFTFVSAAELPESDIARVLDVTGAERVRVIREIIKNRSHRHDH